MQHLYQYRITLKQQVILFFRVPLMWIILIVAAAFFLQISLLSDGFLYTALGWFTIDTLPTIAVHTQYWFKNHGAIFTIDTLTKQLSYKNEHEELNYSFSEIIALHYYWNFGKGSGFNSFGQYRYYKLVFRDETEIIITCLMINNIENTLETLLDINARKHGKLLCLID